MTMRTAMRVATNDERVLAQSVRLGAEPPEQTTEAGPLDVPIDFLRTAQVVVQAGGEIPAVLLDAVLAAEITFEAVNRLQGGESSTPRGCVLVGPDRQFVWLHGRNEWLDDGQGPHWYEIRGACASYGGTPIHNAVLNGGIGHLTTATGRLLVQWIPRVRDGVEVTGGYFLLLADEPLLAALGIADQLRAIGLRVAAEHEKAIATIRKTELF